MLLIEKINMVLADQLKQTSFTYRSGKWNTTTLFFEKHQITLKVYWLSQKRDGRAYIKKTNKYIITLTPLLRVREFISLGKDKPHSSIIEYSYRGNWIATTFCESEIGKTGLLAIHHMLKYYGYKPDIYRSIVPWGKAIDDNEQLKRLWRHDDVREIFKALRIKPKKSLSRMLFSHIANDKHDVLPLLSSIKFLWNLCQDENLLAEVWPEFNKNFSMWDMEKEQRRAWNCMIKDWPKHTRTAFTRSLSKIKRKEHQYWEDVLRMVTNIYDDLGQVKVRGRNIRALHDNLIGEGIKVATKRVNTIIEYEEEYKQIHGYEFSNKIGMYKFILPAKTHDIISWGKILDNCMADYAKDVLERYNTLVAVVDRAKNKIIVGLELKHGKVQQMSMYDNEEVDPVLNMAILTALRDISVIESIHPKPQESRNWYNMTPREREAYKAQQWLPGVRPIINIGTFNEQHNNNNERLPF